MIELYASYDMKPKHQWALLKHRAVNFFKDLNSYIDFRLARYIVWRETRRSKKGEQR